MNKGIASIPDFQSISLFYIKQTCKSNQKLQLNCILSIIINLNSSDFVIISMVWQK